MKRIFAEFLLAVLVILSYLIAVPCRGQNISVQINLSSPGSPFVSEWKENPAVGSVLILNHMGKELTVSYEVRVDHPRLGEVFHGKTLPVALAPTGTSVSNRTIDEFVWTEDTWNRDVERFILRTGRFPEGVYTICVKVLVSPEEYAIECQDVEIVYPDPPQLLAPENGAEVSTPNPVFLWTPAVVPANFPVSYELKISPVLEGQTPLRALMANVPQLETTLSATNFPYPLDGLPFENGATYA